MTQAEDTSKVVDERSPKEVAGVENVIRHFLAGTKNIVMPICRYSESPAGIKLKTAYENENVLVTG